MFSSHGYLEKNQFSLLLLFTTEDKMYLKIIAANIMLIANRENPNEDSISLNCGYFSRSVPFLSKK